MGALYPPLPPLRGQHTHCVISKSYRVTSYVRIALSPNNLFLKFNIHGSLLKWPEASRDPAPDQNATPRQMLNSSPHAIPAQPPGAARRGAIQGHVCAVKPLIFHKAGQIRAIMHLTEQAVCGMVSGIGAFHARLRSKQPGLHR